MGHLETNIGTLTRHCANPRCTRTPNAQMQLPYDAPTKEPHPDNPNTQRPRRLKIFCDKQCRIEVFSRRRSLELALHLLDTEIAKPAGAARDAPKETLELWRRRIQWELDGIPARTHLSA